MVKKVEGPWTVCCTETAIWRLALKTFKNIVYVFFQTAKEILKLYLKIFQYLVLNSTSYKNFSHEWQPNKLQLIKKIKKKIFTGENLVYTVVMPTEPRSFRKMQFQRNMNNLLNYVTSIGRNEGGYFPICDVTMPKFNLEFDYDALKKHLLSLGINLIYEQ